jgi:uncharacterized protein
MTEQQHQENPKKFKILSLDGGGIRGVISAQILQEVETQLKLKKNKSLHEYFDLVAGTSTGSILAAAIALEKKPEELIKLYLEEGDKIFPEATRNRRKYLQGFVVPHWSRYSNKGLIEVLKDKLKTPQGQPLKISEINKPILLILAYDTLSRNTTWFASDGGDRWYQNIDIWEICVSSASAPTFFPPYLLTGKNGEKYPHIDGGVSANNPALTAVSHAMLTQKKKLEDLAVLSIGTGRTTKPFEYEDVNKWGLIGWGQRIPDVFMGAPSEMEESICRQILGGEEAGYYLRLDFDLNERFEVRKPGSLEPRKILPKGKEKNKYTEKVLKENMDDPNICSDLIDAAKAYINYDNQRVVKEIQKFIDNNE